MSGKTTGFGLTTTDGRQPHVAIVNADTTGAVVMTALVEQFGCAWEIARGRKAVVELLLRERSIDIVLLDTSVPDSDGICMIDSIRQIKGSRPLPIVAVDDGRAHIAATTAAARVTKPFSPRDLHAALRSALVCSPIVAAPEQGSAPLPNLAAPQSA